MTAAVRAAAVGGALVFLGLLPATADAQQRSHAIIASTTVRSARV